MRPIRLWQRDLDNLRETKRSPRTNRQIARQHGFSTVKKASERNHLLYEAGFHSRLEYFSAAMQGRGEFVYYIGAKPSLRSLPHQLGLSEWCVQTTEWQRLSPSYEITFYYAHEVPNKSGLVPDATILVHRDEQIALDFGEFDLATEPVTSPSGYSLAHKLSKYAAYFDAQAANDDFSWAGVRRQLELPADDN